jgi:hypothetical protein
MQPTSESASSDLRIVSVFSVTGGIIALAVILLTGSAPAISGETQGSARSARERSFSEHPTHCSQLLGGREFIEPLSHDFSSALELALSDASSRAELQSAFGSLRQACGAALARRSAPQDIALNVD